jgi:hypothetical protein
MDYFAPRQVEEVASGVLETTQAERKVPKALDELRHLHCWVLLGEPGAGKTSCFKQEAEAIGGVYERIEEFLTLNQARPEPGKAFFLDGLDETRVGQSTASVLLNLRQRLYDLGNPPFRISCRAADWNGRSDRQDLSSSTVDGDVKVFNLLPLNESDVIEILNRNYEGIDSATFIKKAATFGVNDLLTNPQTLGLLAKAVRGERWPKTRRDVFELACETLCMEGNKTHRNIAKQTSSLRDTESLLTSAGHLFAVMLLSDKSGVACDQDSKNDRFPLLECFVPADFLAAQKVVHTRLFLQASNEERLEPSHRIVAEFLAARWLANQIEVNGLSLHRVKNLMLGVDQKVVAGLRGVYGWLALLSVKARAEFIDNDPLTIMLYGDVEPMPTQDKQRLLDNLQKEFERNEPVFLHLRNDLRINTLFDEALDATFLRMIEPNPLASVKTSHTVFILKVLFNNTLSEALLAAVYEMICDESFWGRYISIEALKVWINAVGHTQKGNESALSLLEEINDKKIIDSSDGLAGVLLNHLFPRTISPSLLLKYAHKRSDNTLFGSYVYFWIEELPKVLENLIDPSGLAEILDQLSDHKFFQGSLFSERTMSSTLSRLLIDGIERLGDGITDERLLRWLLTSEDKFGTTHYAENLYKSLDTWLSTRPNRYKGLLQACFDRCLKSTSPRACFITSRAVLERARPPKDLGLWHLKALEELPSAPLLDHQDFTIEHVRGFMSTLLNGVGAEGLRLEDVEEWAGNDLRRKKLLQPYLYAEIPVWRLEQQRRQADQEANKKAYYAGLLLFTAKIRQGTAPVELLHALSGIWRGTYSSIAGDVPKDRFADCFDHSEDIYTAAEQGFSLSPLTLDIADVEQIIDLFANKKREYKTVSPCMIGMNIRWEKGFAEIDELGEKTLRKLVCLRLTDRFSKVPDWFSYIALSRPELVAEVVIKFISTCFAAKYDGIREIHTLLHDEGYQEVRRIALPEILLKLPFRLDSNQIRDFKNVLLGYLKFCRDDDYRAMENRLRLKSLDMPQRLFLLAAAAFASPDKYAKKLIAFVGKSWKKTELIVSFSKELMPELNQREKASVFLLGNLLEIQAASVAVEFLNHLLAKLVDIGTREVATEMERLLSQPLPENLRFQLQRRLDEVRQRIRESKFDFLPFGKVVEVLANKAPSNSLDLQIIALDALRDIAADIHGNPSNLYKQFWNQDGAKKSGHKDEPSCRDALLPMLCGILNQFDVDCQPEAQYVFNNRADIRLSYKAEFELPIEVKGEWHRELWSAAKDQLIRNYSIAPKANGYGIFLVLWTGGTLQMLPKDGGRRAKNAAELQERLTSTIPVENRGKVKVFVLDVSWRSKDERKLLAINA